MGSEHRTDDESCGQGCGRASASVSKFAFGRPQSPEGEGSPREGALLEPGRGRKTWKCHVLAGREQYSAPLGTRLIVARRMVERAGQAADSCGKTGRAWDGNGVVTGDATAQRRFACRSCGMAARGNACMRATRGAGV